MRKYYQVDCYLLIIDWLEIFRDIKIPFDQNWGEMEKIV